MKTEKDDPKGRQDAVDRLRIMDSPEEQAYDDITRLAASAFETPIALIVISDSQRNWFKSRVGLQVKEMPSANSFCAHAISKPDEVMVIPDARKDERFANHPLVIGEPHLRFYAGVPLLSAEGIAIGTICVIDTKPRASDPQQLEELKFLARQVMVMLEGRVSSSLSTLQD